MIDEDLFKEVDCYIAFCPVCHLRKDYNKPCANCARERRLNVIVLVCCIGMVLIGGLITLGGGGEIIIFVSSLFP